MKHFLFALLFGFVCPASAKAQDARYVGTWKWHYDSPYEDGEEGPPPRDEFIRIDIEDSIVYVRLKIMGKDGYGRPFQSRNEGENVSINADGSISFDKFLSKKEYDNEDRLYWTVWTHYTIKYGGGRLLSSEKDMGEAYNKNGILVKEDKNRTATQKVYYNEKDNW